jgi:GDP-L-fucose synthase
MLGSTLQLRFAESQIQMLHPSRAELNLFDRDQVLEYVHSNQPDAIIHCAAVVGGIQMNIDFKSKLFTENIHLDTNMITAAAKYRIPNLIYIGSSCMYPANIDHPIHETELLTGSLETTNHSYAMAKIFGTELVKSYREQLDLNWTTVVASNLYGPRDKFDPKNSHLVASVIRKVIFAKDKSLETVEVWGDGESRREFTYTEDFANWIYNLIELETLTPPLLNAGIGIDLSVREWYELVMEIVGCNAKLSYDYSKPSGNKRKLMDSSLARNYGWNPRTLPREGIEETIKWYMKGLENDPH